MAQAGGSSVGRGGGLPRALLLATGILGGVLYLPVFLVAGLWGWALGAGDPLELLMLAAPLVLFAFYGWVVFRPWSARRLAVWGAVVHLPLVWWLPRAGDQPELLVLAAGLLTGLVVYTLYAWSLRGR